MKHFAALYTALDESRKTSAKVDALAAYLQSAPPACRIWTIALLTGRRPKRAVSAAQLRQWAAAAAGLPDWLFDESYHIAGDLAETIALVLPPPRAPRDQSLTQWITDLRALHDQPLDARRAAIVAAWDALGGVERIVFTKLLTGGFRVGISTGLLVRALAQITGQSAPDLMHRLMGRWHPDTTDWDALITAQNISADRAHPYPFYLAQPVDDPAHLGDPAAWRAEYKWDGIRAQIIARGGDLFIWSRGQDLVTAQFPELAVLAQSLPDGTVIDGEILAHDRGAALPFGQLQRRLGRKSPSAKLRAAVPVIVMAYDLLEQGGADIRAQPLAQRRAALGALATQAGAPLHLSADLDFATWDDLARARATAADHGAEGVMIKRAASPYGAGRKTGDWWKWKRDPLTIDAVMIYAQAGHGRRANLFTDYTFALRAGDGYVPFTKAYSGLTDAEFAKITAWVRKNTLQKFGPVRQVPPELVFEIGFEGLAASPRHKSGIALRFPRMLRWRQDKPPTQINTLADLQEMLRLYGG